MISQFFSSVCTLLSKVSLGTIAAGLVMATIPIAVTHDMGVAQTATLKIAFLQQFPRHQPSTTLGQSVSTNLDRYRDACRNPQTVSQISQICILLGAFTGQNPDGSVELGDLTYDTPAIQIIRPEEATSAPQFTPIGLIRPEQNDVVQLFPRP